MEEDLQERLPLGSPSICERRPVVHRSPERGPLVDPIPSPLLPFVEPPPQPKQRRIGHRDVLRGGFVVIVDLETHCPNEGDIFRPILGIENEVRDRLVRLVRDDRSGGRRCLRLPSPNLAGSLLEHRRPSLGRMEPAGDGVASIKNRHERLPPPSRHLTTNGDEVIEPLVLHGVEDRLGNDLRRAEEFQEHRAACSLAETKPCPRRSHGWSIFCDV